uniref:TMEM205-like domain-containing protein n=1 Tax=uncultured bacterium W4-21b TaxID=1130993 RepID=H9BWM8_9BACT|nr:hypothetical protein [uncultured bacterium W4-21b]
MTWLLKSTHLLSVSIWLGSIVFFSFFAAPAIFKTLPKETAGDVISAVISKYYLLTSAAGGIAVVTAILLGMRADERTLVELLKTLLLMGMLTATLYAGTVLHTQIREVKVKIRTETVVEDKSRFETEFKALHKRSVILNGTTLVGAILVLTILASKIKP